MKYSIDYNLDTVLSGSDNTDLDIIVDHITDKGDGRIALSSDACKKLTAAKNRGVYNHEELELISYELRTFGGNSFMNFFRGEGVSYKEVLTDVAEHLKINFNKNNSCEKIELEILLKVLEKAVENMSESERRDVLESFGGKYTSMTGPALTLALQTVIRSSGFAAYKLAAIIAQATAKAILGRGLAYTTTAPIMQGISIFSGPIGWVITGIWAAFDLASPAYRVTVPCVIQIAYMRQKLQNKEKEKELNDSLIISNENLVCNKCYSSYKKGSKFCPECGAPVGLLKLTKN